MNLRGISKMYQDVLRRRPFLVQAIQTGALMGAGDIISQTFIERKHILNINVTRTAKFASIGFFLEGPLLRVWYGTLYKYIGSSGRTAPLKKVFLDQIVFTPIFLFAILCAVGLTQGKDYDGIVRDLQANYLDVLKANYFLWPWVQIINFAYVPLRYQVLLVQVIALFWNTYLSWKVNKHRVIKQ